MRFLVLVSFWLGSSFVDAASNATSSSTTQRPSSLQPASNSIVSLSPVPSASGDSPQTLLDRKLSSLTLHDLLSNQSAVYNELFGNNLASTNSFAANGNGGGGLFGKLINGIANTLVEPAMFLGMGIGTGTVDGLQLPTKSQPPATPSGVDGVAMNLGKGITSTLFSLVDVASVIGAKNGDITATIAPLALNLAQGLGSGAANTLQLNGAAANTTAMFPSSGFGAIAGNFGTGLSTSFLTSAGINAKTAFSQNGLLSGFSQTLIPTALSFGEGIGSGSALGFGLQANIPLATGSGNNNFDFPLIAGTFARGLATSFLSNGTFTALAKSANISIEPAGLVQKFATQIGPAALGFGSGLGSGSAVGLGLRAGSTSDQQANAADIKSVVQTFSTALSSSFLANGTFDALTKTINLSGSASNLMANIGPAVAGFGKGLGGGAAIGLGLQQRSIDSLQGGKDVSGLAETFSSALSSNFLSNGTLNALASVANLNPSALTSDLVSKVAPVVVGLGKGLGGGTAVGLGFQASSDSVGLPESNDVEALSQAFGGAVSSSFLANNTLSGITKSLNMMVDPNALKAQIAPAAIGFGKGLGSGAAIGLGLQTDVETSVDSNADVDQISQAFARGMTSNFLANGTITRLFALGGNVDGFAVSSGFARGLLVGAGNTIQQVGGIRAIFDGEAKAPASDDIPLPANASADSLNGASTGFGTGLGSEGILLGLKLFGKMGGNLARRDESSIGVLNTPTLVSNMTPIMIDGALQFGADALTCEGFGGLLKVLVGLMTNKLLGFDLSKTSQLETFTDAFPDETFTVKSNGNTYQINIRERDLIVNGLPLLKVIIVLTLHVFSASLIYLFVIPFVWTLETLRSMVVLMGRPDLIPKIPRWVKLIRLLVILPVSIFTIVMGIVGSGNTKFFGSPHAIIGLVTFLVTLTGLVIDFKVSNAATINRQIEIAQQAHIVLISVLGSISALTGFLALSSVSFCIISIIPPVYWVALGSTVLGGVTIAMSIMGIQIYLRKRVPGGSLGGFQLREKDNFMSDDF